MSNELESQTAENLDDNGGVVDTPIDDSLNDDSQNLPNTLNDMMDSSQATLWKKLDYKSQVVLDDLFVWFSN